MSNRRAPAKTVPADQETGGSAEGSLGSSRARSVSGTTKRTAQLGEEPPKTAKVMKKQPAFNPRPVGGPSGADADQSMRLPPPPPSERKIARKRESTRAAREQEPESPPQVKRQKTSSKPTSGRARGTTPADPLLAELRADAGSNPFQATAVPRVDFLNFSKPVKGKSAAPRPSSPPRMPDLSHTRQSMGPPTGPYVRKTRKSMRGMGLDSLSAETLVPIPDGETPMIKKNKEMRNEQARRSSLGMRGQRASSSLGRGEISIPHPSVDSTLLYKHIASTLPEPHRARHLLVYCAKRTTDMSVAPVSSKSKRKAKPTDEVRSDEGDRLVSEIMEQFMTNLGKGVIETNVFAGPDRDSRSALSGLRPHPRNESNRIVKANDDAAIKRGKEQSAIWHSLVMRTNRRQAEMSEKISQKKTANSDPDMSVAPPWMREALKLANDLIAQGAGELTDKGEFADVEYKVDTLHAASHAARQYTLTASRFLDGVFSSLSADLAPAGRPAPAAASGAEGDGIETGTLLATTAASGSVSTGGPAGGSTRNRPDPMAMLRALAAADAKNAPDETVAAAARLAPVVSSSAAATSSSTGGSGSSSLNVSTSRRTEAPTPRRPGVTPRRAGVLGSGTTPKR